jgi:hypothetical protein
VGVERDAVAPHLVASEHGRRRRRCERVGGRAAADLDGVEADASGVHGGRERERERPVAGNVVASLDVEPKRDEAGKPACRAHQGTGR